MTCFLINAQAGGELTLPAFDFTIGMFGFHTIN